MGNAHTISAIDHNIDERLYKNAVLYFIKYCNNQFLGRTKLNKLLYYLDFIAYRDWGKSVTGDIYIRQEFGPVPSHIDEVLAFLKADGSIDTQVVPQGGHERIKFELKNNSALDENVFSQQQKELLGNICNEFGSWSRAKIVSQTHLEAPWFFSRPLEIVDYKHAEDIDFFR